MQKVSEIVKSKYYNSVLEFKNKSVSQLNAFRCRYKVHKEHVDNDDLMATCKSNQDSHSALVMSLLAISTEDQQSWITHLSERIEKFGYNENIQQILESSTGIDSEKTLSL